MIFEVFQILSEQVNQYFHQIGLDDSEVILDNIAFIDGPSDNTEAMRDKVVMSLINLQEESTLKNFPNHRQVNDQFQYRNEIVHLHLFVLFAVNRTTYDKSLKDLSTIISFFQGKKLFTQNNTVFNREVNSMSEVGDFRFTMDLFTPTFEELNFIWGTLGGRQLPSVMYKLCLLPIERNLEQGEGSLVQSISNTVKQK